MRKRIQIGIVLFLAIGCASLSVKERASIAHRAAHSSLTAIDDGERTLCLPNPLDLTKCTRQPMIISDVQHQSVSRLLVRAYEHDIKIGNAIIAWKPGTPIPPELLELRGFLDQVAAVANALTGNDPSVDKWKLIIQNAIIEVERLIATLKSQTELLLQETYAYD